MTTKIILFIPFTVNENNFSLYMRALDWRYASRNLEDKTYKIPSIVIYRHPSEQEQDYEDYDQAQFNFNEAHFEDNTVVYVLADGTGDPNSVVNVNQAYYEQLSEKPYRLFIGSVAWRMKQCGLTPELAHKLKSINLFICDENNTNNQLASFFAQGLGNRYNEVTINYYSAIVNIPQLMLINGNEPKAKKLAFLHSTDGTTKLVTAGYAHEYKHSLIVCDALVQQKSPYNSIELEQSQAHSLPTFKELTSSVNARIEEVMDIEPLQEDLRFPVITSLEVELDTGSPVANAKPELEVSKSYQPTMVAQNTALSVWQERSFFSFFKYVDNSASVALVDQSATDVFTIQPD